jgi:hypothetical protein
MFAMFECIRGEGAKKRKNKDMLMPKGSSWKSGRYLGLGTTDFDEESSAGIPYGKPTG